MSEDAVGKGLSEFCKRFASQRQESRLTQLELRKIAGVQNQLVGILEHPERLSKMVQDFPSWNRGKRSRYLSAITKLCLTLGVEWEGIANSLQGGVAEDEKIRPSEIGRSVSHFSNDVKNRWWNNLETVLSRCHSARETAEKVPLVRVAVLNWEPFSWPGSNGLLDRSSFFFKITEMVVRSIDPFLHVAPHLYGSFRDLHNDITSDPASEYGFPLAIGILPTQTRRELFGVEFIPIPGLRVRLSCLTTLFHASKVTWARVWDAFEKATDQNIRVVTTAEAVAHILRKPERSADASSGSPIVLCDDFDPKSLADTFVKEIIRHKRNSSMTVVLLADEATAALVRHHYYSRRKAEKMTGAFAKSKSAEDVASLVEIAPDEAYSFDLALAVPSTEPRWIEKIRSVLSEDLYSGFGVDTADTYRAIFDRAAQLSLVWESINTRESSKKLYNYLRLRDFAPKIDVGGRFFDTFARIIQFRLQISAHHFMPYSWRRERRLNRVIIRARQTSRELKKIKASIRELSDRIDALLGSRKDNMT